MKQKFEVVVEKEDVLFTTLSIKYRKRINIFYNIQDILFKVFKEYDIEESNVQSLCINQKGKDVCIKVKYCKVNVQALTKSTDKKEQIIITLNHLGYSLEKIRKIECQKKHPKCDKDSQMIWNIELNEHYDPDESFSQADYEMSLSKALSKFLETDISVSMY